MNLDLKTHHKVECQIWTQNINLVNFTKMPFCCLNQLHRIAFSVRPILTLIFPLSLTNYKTYFNLRKKVRLISCQIHRITVRSTAKTSTCQCAQKSIGFYQQSWKTRHSHIPFPKMVRIGGDRMMQHKTKRAIIFLHHREQIYTDTTAYITFFPYLINVSARISSFQILRAMLLQCSLDK